MKKKYYLLLKYITGVNIRHFHAYMYTFEFYYSHVTFSNFEVKVFAQANASFAARSRDRRCCRRKCLLYSLCLEFPEEIYIEREIININKMYI